MRDCGFWIAFAMSGVVALIGSLPLYELVSNDRLVVLALPGMLASMAVSRNVHAFSATLSLVFAWTFWLVLFLLMRKLWRRIHAA